MLFVLLFSGIWFQDYLKEKIDRLKGRRYGSEEV